MQSKGDGKGKGNSGASTSNPAPVSPRTESVRRFAPPVVPPGQCVRTESVRTVAAANSIWLANPIFALADVVRPITFASRWKTQPKAKANANGKGTGKGNSGASATDPAPVAPRTESVRRFAPPGQSE